MVALFKPRGKFQLHRNQRYAAAAVSGLVLFLSGLQVNAADSWQSLDRRVQSQVLRVNVAVKIKLKTFLYAQLADLSPKKHYPVFATTNDDRGYRVVGYGTCFPVKAARKDGTYFLTNKHVVDFGTGMIQECQRFFAAMRLQAERTAGMTSPEDKYHELLWVVNLSMKKGLAGSERAIYEATVDSIWDTYDNHLSIKADPDRTLFNKYADLAGVDGEADYFIHQPGPSSKAPMPALLYRAARKEPDLAILEVPGAHIKTFDLDDVGPKPGQIVQAIGYPAIKQSGVLVPPVYEPTFTAGRVKTVSPEIVEFAAPVSKGDSGGPLIDQHGHVVGVVVRRALIPAPLNAAGPDTAEEFAAAVSVPAIRAFASELFLGGGTIEPVFRY